MSTSDLSSLLGDGIKGTQTLSLILDGIGLPVLIKDSGHRFRFVNQAAGELLARLPEQMLGRTDHDFVDKAQADRFCSDDDRVLASGGEIQVSEQITLADGTTRDLITLKRRISLEGPHGTEHMVVATIADVTQTQQLVVALRESEDHFRAMADHAPVIIWVSDQNGNSTMINRLWTETTGQSEAEALGFGWLNAVHPEDRDRVTGEFQVACDRTAPVRIEYRLWRSDGVWRWVLDVGQPRFGQEGDFLGYVGSALDITERRAAEIALAESERRLSTVFAQTMMGILHRDTDNHVLMVNQRFCDIVGRSKDELEGLPMKAFTHPEDYPENEEIWERHSQSGEPFQLEKRYIRPDGTSIWCAVNVSFILDDQGRPLSTIAFAEDIDQRRQAEQAQAAANAQLMHMSRHDMLTGLPNRLRFIEILDETLLTRDPAEHVSVLSLGVDGFKAVNDTLGHACGDALLRQIAERLRHSINPTDVLARLGGDEFAIVMRGKSHRAAATAAKRIIHAMLEPFDLESQRTTVGVSIGLALGPRDGEAPESLLKAATIALQDAKANQTGSYVAFDLKRHEAFLSRLATKQKLQDALARDELELHYQPLIDITTGTVSACEALIRWRDPSRGLVAPSEFIPIAEETGLIIAIGEWVLQEACAEAATWPSGMSVSVNLSSKQFQSNVLVESVANTLARNKLEARRLQLEIVESVLLDNSAANLATLHDLRKLGVLIAMDDFGTGYSSLGYLRSFPFDKIKIDRAFIQDVPDGKESLAVLRAVSGLAKSLDIATTVEGVETEAQLAVVRAEGFKEVQGYLFSRPLRADDLRSQLQTGKLKPRIEGAGSSPDPT